MADNEKFWTAVEEIRDMFQETMKDYDADADAAWNELSHDDQLRMFYSVVKRIYDANVNQDRSYRGTLYDVFEFDMSSYVTGMECGFMAISNLLHEGKNHERLLGADQLVIRTNGEEVYVSEPGAHIRFDFNKYRDANDTGKVAILDIDPTHKTDFRMNEFTEPPRPDIMDTYINGSE